MNLITGDWLPVIFNNEVTRLVGLKELFENSDEITDLVLNPPQRISIMRLLTCIAQTALDGPVNEEAWMKCKTEIVQKSLEYLKTRTDKFNLYGEKPFLQIEGATSDSKANIDKLDGCVPSGNNPVLNDHEAVPEGRSRSDAWKAINLLTFLNFSTGGKIGQVNLNGEKYSDSTYAAPCIGSAHTFIRGTNLLETIFFNLLTKAEVNQLPNGKWGMPVWDKFPETANAQNSLDNASKTYLGRLVPLSRFMLIDSNIENTACVIGPTSKNIKFEGIPAFREPSNTILLNKKNESYSMKVSSDRHIWRDLGSLLAMSNSNQQGGAVVLNKINRLCSSLHKSNIDIWVGGLELGDQAAKLHDLVEYNFSLPVSLFGEVCLKKYQEGVSLANEGSNTLKSAAKKYCDELKMESSGSISSMAGLVFWQKLDHSYRVLIDTANDEAKSLDNEWRDKVNLAMKEAYQYACPCETPRQIQAFVNGKRFLNIRTDNKNKEGGN